MFLDYILVLCRTWNKNIWVQ